MLGFNERVEDVNAADVIARQNFLSQLGGYAYDPRIQRFAASLSAGAIETLLLGLRTQSPVTWLSTLYTLAETSAVNYVVGPTVVSTVRHPVQTFTNMYQSASHNVGAGYQSASDKVSAARDYVAAGKYTPRFVSRFLGRPTEEARRAERREEQVERQQERREAQQAARRQAISPDVEAPAASPKKAAKKGKAAAAPAPRRSTRSRK